MDDDDVTSAVWIFLTIGILAFTSVCMCCLCCCGIPLWLLVGYCRKTKVTEDKAYEMVNTEPYQTSLPLPSAPPLVDAYADSSSVPIVQAYAVAPMTYHTVEVVSEGAPDKDESQGRYNDIWAALLFLLNVVVITYFAMDTVLNDAEFNRSVVQPINDHQSFFLTAMAIILLISVITGLFWLSVVINYSRSIIKMMLWVNVFLNALMACMALLAGEVMGFIILTALSLLTCCYMRAIEDRIAFASAILSLAASAIKNNYMGIITVVYSLLIVQLIWCCVWGIAFLNVYQDIAATHNPDDDNDAALWVAIVFLLLSFYWGCQVIKYVVQCTVGGSVACWWFHPNHAAPVRGSLFRSITYNFGSICFGALLVSILQTMRDLLHMLKSQREDRRENRREQQDVLLFLICILDCMLSCLESIVVYFNKYAFCYVAAYGTDFVTSGKNVMTLFEERGWTAIINDNLISNVFLFGSILLTCLCGALGMLVAQFLPVDADNGAIYLGVVGAFVGGSTGLVLGNIVDSAVAMMFVCFAENPLTLEATHSAEYYRLCNAWREHHPAAYDTFVRAQPAPSAPAYGNYNYRV